MAVADTPGCRNRAFLSGRHFLIGPGLPMLALFLIGLVFASQSACAAEQKTRVLATVNGKPVSVGRVDLYLQSQGVPESEWPEHRSAALEQFIDRLLIQDFLDSRGVTAPTATLDRQVGLVEKVLEHEADPEATLQRLGLTREQLRQELTLPLAWQRYVRQVVSEQHIVQYFEEHRAELDGTKRRVSQIFLNLPQDATDADVAAGLARLSELQTRISAGDLTFADAARQFSAAPSAAAGGDLGAFPYAGVMPAEIARPSFATPVGQMCQPFRSRFGLHLLLVTGEIPGQYSLEDVRRDILNQFADQLWRENVTRLRKTSRIVIHSS